jgi:long-chain acyl-CoA synthetase
MDPVTDISSVSKFLDFLSAVYGDRPALHGRNGSTWKTLTYRDLVHRSRQAGQALLRRGLQPEDKIAILAKSKPDFAVGFFATALTGAITVPLDVRLTVQDQSHVLQFTEAKALICFRDETETIAKALQRENSSVQMIILDDLFEEEEAEPQSFPDRESNQLTIIAMTSGTVSRPKGVMLAWRNFTSQMEAIAQIFRPEDGMHLLSILPLHHMFEFTTGLLTPLSRGGEVFYGDSFIPHQILSFLKDKKISEMLVVPLFLKALKMGIEAEVNRSRWKKYWFRFSQALAAKLPWRWSRRYLFFPIHRKLGGHFQRFISGASKLDREVRDFFDRLGIDVFEGYGLTETSPIVAANSTLRHRPGTVGRALPGVEVKKRQESGELLVRGPNVMLGYYRDLQSTRESVSADGWFNTGDVVEIDHDGFIKIVGRTKEIIVLGNGKKVVPEEVEAYFQDCDLMQEICIIGTVSQQGMAEGTEVVTAVVVPHQARMRELNLDPQQAETQLLAQLKMRSLKISYFKRPAEFIFVQEPLPRTSTQKVKRSLVKARVEEQRRKL